MDVSFLCVAAGVLPMGPMRNRVLIPDGTMFPVVLRAVRPVGRGNEAAHPPATRGTRSWQSVGMR